MFENREAVPRTIYAAALLAVAAAVALLVWPGTVELLTGIAPEPELSAPDELSAAASDNPLPFLMKRDVIEIRVAEATTLRQFLDRNHLNKDTQVRQIAEQ
ncbi:MAG TPA: hypothetical protein VHK90_10950, partial [Thermoanaerobaculia bacterium]|nr:hypothetical protein [Thermoanaerobaculia bacterium]